MGVSHIFIGLNGGHHTSSALAYAPESDVLSMATGQSLNMHRLPLNVILYRLDKLLTDLCSRVGMANTDALYLAATGRMVISLPGAGLADDQDYASAIVRHAGCKNARIVDDTWAGLFEETLEESGICAFAGTGASVCVAMGEFVPGKVHKIDGWGPVIGDYGSGFQLVTDFFRWLGRELDLKHASPLFDEVRKLRPDIRSLEHVQRWFDMLYLGGNQEWPAEYAAIAKAITLAADREDNPDRDACCLVEKCAHDMVTSIQIALTRFGGQSQGMPLVFQGGMFWHSRLYRDTVARGLCEKVEHVILARHGPDVGALLMACTPDVALMHHIRDVKLDKSAKQSNEGCP